MAQRVAARHLDVTAEICRGSTPRRTRSVCRSKRTAVVVQPRACAEPQIESFLPDLVGQRRSHGRHDLHIVLGHFRCILQRQSPFVTREVLILAMLATLSNRARASRPRIPTAEISTLESSKKAPYSAPARRRNFSPPVGRPAWKTCWNGACQWSAERRCLTYRRRRGHV